MKILIADDDLTARTILTGILKKWDYEVVAAPDGLAAWEIMEQPDCPLLIILDWMMPGLDGLELIRRLRAKFSWQPLYIILLTSKNEKGDILSGLETGANDYIKKPFDSEELYARIRVGQRTIDLQTSLYESQQNLAHLAAHDPLTGILNRRAILEQLSKELARIQRLGGRDQDDDGLSVGFFDIDHFKHINDHYSHQVGDEVLRGLVEILSSQMRAYDSFGRLGGDEFLVIAPGLDVSKRKNFFERLKTTIASSGIKTSAGELSVTVSMGVTHVSPENNIDQVLDSADTTMYRAKRDGGNSIVYTE